MRFEDLHHRRVVVWGAGREGLAAMEELTTRGIEATVAVTGSGTLPEGLPGASGQAGLEALLGADVVVKSPGIPKTSEEFRRLTAAGVRLTSLSDLWLGVNRARVIGVTGTKGKSTTSMVTSHILATLGWDSRLVGNVGTAVTGVLREDQVAVMEVSSYQASSLTTSPRVAVVTSLFPEHLPWHGGLEAYRDDKFNLLAHDPEVVVVSDLQPELRERAALVAPRAKLLTPAGLGLHVTAESIIWQGVGELSSDELPLRGRHNVGNAALALAAATAWCGDDLDASTALGSLKEVQPLEHRLQVVPSNDGRTWVDDSLATNPQAVTAALTTYPDSPVVLILGGSERDLPFGPLIDFLASREAPTQVLTIGPAGHRFADEADGRIPGLVKADGFADAMRRARTSTLTDAVVLLSPCAPSFDEFTDYRDRSKAFRDAALA
ncbi:UDP-N-acetylmuramoyl-L-alanine--D-glutamate ligase [Arachnia propionica]|uniref:UDP-N-acetylmuramoylalanine--D-glutamate ligase n=1 Tax=Arachnia propionica TaxID=1750 RepID=A0A3P1T437_9ACTN|nr:UDP-N-acetylmuramoyl-L-alanine--D-glutamate ligase [Arachnia propionica]RRD04064.1 UDP-N-acetylmuramoyl-L-alanine--D-glutamate ligase [Arachnia propionica]